MRIIAVGDKIVRSSRLVPNGIAYWKRNVFIMSEADFEAVERGETPRLRIRKLPG